MVSPYAGFGFLGGFVLLGVCIYNVWTQARQRPHSEYGPTEDDVEARRDRPQNNDWGNDPDKKDNCRQRKKSGSAVCGMCGQSWARVGLKKLSCNHIFHDDCVKERQSCPTCGSPA